MRLGFFYRRWLLTHAAITLVVFFLVDFLVGPRESVSVVVGASAMAISLAILVISLARILEKKHVAVYGSLIVIKYAIFGVLIYRVASQAWMSGLWFGLGLLVAVLSLSLHAQSLVPADVEAS